MQADILLRGGEIIDGVGSPRRQCDVAVKNGRIAAVGALPNWEAQEILDVGGLVVAPGFIDMHTHSDLSLLLNPRAESKLRQGVTTEVIGQCGFSPAPTLPTRREAIRARFGEWAHKVDWTWSSFGEYLEVLQASRPSVNVVPIVGHGIVRTGVMGEENRPPTDSEMAEMKAAVLSSLDEGAFGVSSGLAYVPGIFAETEELVELASLAAPTNGVYFSHIRGEGETLLKAVWEAIEIGRRARVRVQISHLKAEGRTNWGKVGQALDLIDEARELGVDVGFDVYPYTAWNTSLGQMLPAWAREGGVEAILARLQNRTTRARVKEELDEAATTDPGRWERRLLSSVESAANRPLQGKTIAQIAIQRGTTPADTVIDLLLEERYNADMVGFGMAEEDVRVVLAHRLATIGSDSSSHAPYGLLGEGHPHPRTYGTFARVLGHYARDEKLFSLEEAVAKMTSRTAVRLGLRDRGKISIGYAADLVVFDPDTIADTATYEQPHQYAAGIKWVIVNGVIELAGDEHKGKGAGMVFRR